MKRLLAVYTVLYAILATLFAVVAIALILLATQQLWGALTAATGGPPTRLDRIVEGFGLIAVALVALEMSQTVIEEEILRRADVSAPTRVRRFLSRFLVVVVVALTIEYLVGVIRFLHSDVSALGDVSTIGLGAAALLAAWGVFIRLNRSAEDVEPEAMAQAKREDPKVHGS
ncbi:MAG: hypothetical protein ACT4R6_00585 [Gemmatimonadaceae bacterium]